MQKMCVSQPTTVEMLDALEARIAALRAHNWLHWLPAAACGVPPSVRANILNGRTAGPGKDSHRTHPFSRIEEL
jgi:hypothetical protein